MKLLLLITAISGIAVAQDKPVPVEQEPHHRTVLQNSYLQVFRVKLAPGENSEMHTHAHNDAAVRLSNAKVRVDLPGKPNAAEEEVHQGAVSARTNEPNAFTHKVNNIGATPFDVLDIQILKRPDGPEVKAFATPAAENPSMRVYRYELSPGESSPQHSHERPYLVVAANDMNLKMSSSDGRSMEDAPKAGDLHWVDRKLTHTRTNTGTKTAVIAEIELK